MLQLQGRVGEEGGNVKQCVVDAFRAAAEDALLTMLRKSHMERGTIEYAEATKMFKRRSWQEGKFRAYILAHMVEVPWPVKGEDDA